jgi:hypothetical protein
MEFVLFFLRHFEKLYWGGVVILALAVMGVVYTFLPISRRKG